MTTDWEQKRHISIDDVNDTLGMLGMKKLSGDFAHNWCGLTLLEFALIVRHETMHEIYGELHNKEQP